MAASFVFSGAYECDSIAHQLGSASLGSIFFSALLSFLSSLFHPTRASYRVKSQPMMSRLSRSHTTTWKTRCLSVLQCISHDISFIHSLHLSSCHSSEKRMKTSKTTMMVLLLCLMLMILRRSTKMRHLLLISTLPHILVPLFGLVIVYSQR